MVYQESDEVILKFNILTHSLVPYFNVIGTGLQPVLTTITLDHPNNVASIIDPNVSM